MNIDTNTNSLTIQLKHLKHSRYIVSDKEFESRIFKSYDFIKNG